MLCSKSGIKIYPTLVIQGLSSLNYSMYKMVKWHFWLWPLQVAQWDSQNGIAWEQSTSALDDDLVSSVRKTGLRVVTKLVPSHIILYCTRITKYYTGHRAVRITKYSIYKFSGQAVCDAACKLARAIGQRALRGLLREAARGAREQTRLPIHNPSGARREVRLTAGQRLVDRNGGRAHRQGTTNSTQHLCIYYVQHMLTNKHVHENTRRPSRADGGSRGGAADHHEGAAARSGLLGAVPHAGHYNTVREARAGRLLRATLPVPQAASSGGLHLLLKSILLLYEYIQILCTRMFQEL